VRPFSATYSKSGSAVLPPRRLLPRQPYTPNVGMHTSPADTAASAFVGDSVMNSGTAGSASLPLMDRGTSSTIRAPCGVSYFAGLPLRIRGLSGRYWWNASLPCTSYTGMTSPGVSPDAATENPCCRSQPGSIVDE
jgi:hypothetical protein